MTLVSTIPYMSLVELSQLVSKKEISCLEIITAVIERIQERNGNLNALIYTDNQSAIYEAKIADKEILQGHVSSKLHGMPTAIKDLGDYKKGWPHTLGGLPFLAENLAKNDSPYTKLIQTKGAVVVGSTNSPSFGFRGTCDNYLYGPTCNPFDLSRNSCGSSGGAAAAVADGMIPFAQGTDGGGSIRIPASACNLFGYKASFGRVPFIVSPNSFSTTSPFLFVGPLTRSVADSALVMNEICTYDARDPFSTSDRLDFRRAIDSPKRKLKIGYSRNLDVFSVDTQVEHVVRSSLTCLAQEGYDIDEIKIGIKLSQNELSDLWCRMIVRADTFNIQNSIDDTAKLIKKNNSLLPPEFTYWSSISKSMSSADFWNDQVMQANIFQVMQSVFDRYDILITPTLACLPVKNSKNGNTLGPETVNGDDINSIIGWCLTFPFNFTGNPAASIPAGMCEGVPVGMQVIGGFNKDLDVFSVCSDLERLSPWSQYYEICRNRPLNS